MNYKRNRGSVAFLLNELRIYTWYSTILPIMKCCTEVALSLILIVLPKDVLNYIQNGRSYHELMEKILLLGAILALVTIMNLVLQTEILKVSQTFLYRRLNFLWERKAIRVTYDCFISSKGKVTMERARNVISSPNWGVVELLGKITSLIEAVAGLIVFSILVSKLNIIMLLLLVVLFTVELLCGLFTEKKKQTFKEENAKINRKINYIAYGTNGVREAKDIRIYAMVPLLKEITKQVIHKKDQVESDVHRYQFISLFITAVTILIRDGIAYTYLIHLYRVNTMTIGDFSMYFAAIAGVGVWLTKLANAISDFKETSNYANDFHEFMKLPEAEENKEHYDITSPINFTFRHVSYSYRIYDEEEGEKCIPIIKNLNLVVKSGEKIAIVGTNGAGKTTFIKLLCGMLTPDEGEILVQGIDIRKLSKQQYYSLFSAVFQQSQLLPMSIVDNIMLNVNPEKDMERMWEVLKLAGLKEKIESLPEKENTCLVKRIVEHGIDLSGGQQQRLLLARALYKDAPVLILDEPTAALDPISENEIYQKYNELTKGKTSLFVSHRLASTRFCDRILYMEEGRVVEEGTHEELMNLHGKYSDMFMIQSKYYKQDM